MALCLKQYFYSWAGKTFFRLFTLYFRRKIRLRSGGKLFFWSTNFVGRKGRKESGAIKIWSHLLVSPLFSYLKYYKSFEEVVSDFTCFLQIFLSLLCVYFFFDIFWKESVVFSFCSKKLFCLKCLKTLTVFDKILSFFCIDVVAMTKILPLGL